MSDPAVIHKGLVEFNHSGSTNFLASLQYFKAELVETL